MKLLCDRCRKEFIVKSSNYAKKVRSYITLDGDDVWLCEPCTKGLKEYLSGRELAEPEIIRTVKVPLRRDKK